MGQVLNLHAADTTPLPTPLQSLVADLVATVTPSDATNFYRGAGSAVQRRNLIRYLGRMWAAQPRLMLVAEAPGYRGARLTGVPLTSEAVLLADEVLGAGFERATAARTLQREATATLVWRTLAAWTDVPLLWNIYPFHPHHANRPPSNRPPRAAECAYGVRVALRLVRLFQPRAVVAVGRRAERALTPHLPSLHAVRHPAHGGAATFAAGMAAIRSQYAID